MKPLDGLKVLDFSRVVAGPFATRMLSDLGAQVVKVEPPEGDITRSWGAKRNGVAGYYLQQNAGKANICVDLRSQQARELIFDLVRVSDVVIENYRAGVMDRLGLSWEVLSALNPRLIMASISGFGQGGPDSARGAFAPVIAAEAGFVQRQSVFDDTEPRDPVISISDTNAALHTTVAILAALRAVDKTGIGTHIDIAMLDATLVCDDYIHFAIDEEPVERLGGNYYQLADGGWILINAQLKFFWHQCSTILSIADPAPAGCDLETKIAKRQGAINDWVASHSTNGELQSNLDLLGIEWGVLSSASQALASPTAKHRNVVKQIDDRGGKTRGVIDSPYKFSRYDSGVQNSIAHRGENNTRVLTEWLNYSPQQIQDLTKANVLLAQEGEN